jgi:hypothetical protein
MGKKVQLDLYLKGKAAREFDAYLNSSDKYNAHTHMCIKEAVADLSRQNH